MPDRDDIPQASGLLGNVAILVNKSGALCKFSLCVTVTQLLMPPVMRFVP